MASIHIDINKSIQSNDWWKQLIKIYAVPGQSYEIHCWNEDLPAIEKALKYGHIKQNNSVLGKTISDNIIAVWEYGKIITGIIDDGFIAMLCDCDIHLSDNGFCEMTNFFSIFFENDFSSEHYGRELHFILSSDHEAELQRILESMKNTAIIHYY